MRPFAGLINTDSPLAEDFYEYCTSKEINACRLDKVLGIGTEDGIKDLTPDKLSEVQTELAEENAFIFLPSLKDESNIDESYGPIIQRRLFTVYKVTKTLSRMLLDQEVSARFLYLTTAPGLYGLIDYPFCPIYDLAIHSLVKSLGKELTAMGLRFSCLCTEPLMSILDKKEIRAYRNKMRVIAAKKTPIKNSEIMALIHHFAFKQNHMLSGNIISAGAGTEILL